MRSFGFLTLILLLSCSERESTHEVFQFFPSPSLFEEGVVNKYYEHYHPSNPNQVARTNISYSLLTKIGTNEYTIETFNAGFQLAEYMQVRVLDGQFIIDSSFTIRRVDTIFSQIETPVFHDWREPSGAVFSEVLDFNGQEYLNTRKQLDVYDSIIMNRPAKVIKGQRVVKEMNDETVVDSSGYSFSYVQGFGFFGAQTRRDQSNYVIELVEQMPLSKFNELRVHDKHRVGFIDPSAAIDRDNDFELCDHEQKVADYYNPERGGYAEEKNVLVETIRSQLDRELLFDQSGILIFRFAVNCRGEAGRFVAEGYDLDFNQMNFDQRTIDHLYRILSGLEAWRPVVVRGEKRDAYFYLNFRIKNGELIEILP